MPEEPDWMKTEPLGKIHNGTPEVLFYTWLASGKYTTLDIKCE